MDRLYNNKGMSSLLGNDSVIFLAATNTDNNREYIVINRCNTRIEEVLCVVRSRQQRVGQWTVWMAITW
jgi:hypothetical protein